jgi:hypothetical protein
MTLFLTKESISSYMQVLFLLNKNVDVISKGRRTSDSIKCMPFNGDMDDGLVIG